MNPHAQHRCKALAAAAVFALVLAGCGGNADAGAPDAAQASGATQRGHDAELPPIHADLITEELYRGENSQRRNYRDALARCEAAGFPTTALTSAQLEQLGTVRVRLWFAPGLQVMRQEIFEFSHGDQPGTCHFELLRSGGQSHVDARGARWVDLATGENAEDAPQAHTLNRIAIEPIDARAAAADAGLPVPAASSVAGQACTLWEDPRAGGRRICLWADGRAWGFADDDPSSGCLPEPLSLYEGKIVLAEEPLSGNGCRVTTRRFTVGTPFGATDYALAPVARVAP